MNTVHNVEIFNNFSDYYHFARDLTKEQQCLILHNLDHSLKTKILTAFEQEGWVDLVIMDNLSKLIDFVEKEYKINLFNIKYKVLKGKSVYISKNLWDYIVYELDGYKKEQKDVLIGGIYPHVCENNSNVVFLSKNKLFTKKEY